MSGPGAGAPRPVEVAFWCHVAAGVVCFALVALGLTRLGAPIPAASGRDGAIVIVGLAVVLGAELAEGVLFIVFGRLARRGARWARTGLVVLTVIALLGVTEGGFVLGALRLLLAAVGTALLFTTPARLMFSR